MKHVLWKLCYAIALASSCQCLFLGKTYTQQWASSRKNSILVRILDIQEIKLVLSSVADSRDICTCDYDLVYAQDKTNTQRWAGPRETNVCSYSTRKYSKYHISVAYWMDKFYIRQQNIERYIENVSQYQIFFSIIILVDPQNNVSGDNQYIS